MLGYCSSVMVDHVLDQVYRPWAWFIGARDVHLADSFTNATSVVVISALMVVVEGVALIHDRSSAWSIVVAPVTGMIAYECIQPLLPFGTFDVWDIVWTVVGGVVALLVKCLVYDPRVAVALRTPESPTHERSDTL